jgi:ATP-dependent protease Clp ATPase subunit
MFIQINTTESFLLFFPGTFCKITKVIDKKYIIKNQNKNKETKKQRNKQTKSICEFTALQFSG